MPIKFPKTFRRSSQNALDTIENPPEHSFRVLPRPQDSYKSFDGGDKLTRPRPTRPKSSTLQQQHRPRSYGDNSDSSNRGSGNTYESLSTGGVASSHRASYDSTVASSIDSEDLPNPKIPLPRTYSEPLDGFAPKSRSTPLLSSRNSPASTGTKIRNTNPLHSTSNQADYSQEARRTGSNALSSEAPLQIDFGTGLDWDYGSSGFGETFRTSPQEQQSPKLLRRSSTLRPDSTTNDLKSQVAQSQSASKNPETTSLKENEDPRRNSFGPGDDSQVVIDAVYASHTLEQENFSSLSSTPLVGRKPLRNNDRPRDGQMNPTSTQSSTRTVQPRYSPSPNGLFGTQELEVSSGRKSGEEPLFRRTGVSPYQRSKSKSPASMGSQNKIMTPAEFEQYKRQKAVAGEDADDAKSDVSSESDNYEDEDEIEKQKQNMKQRRKQEAHLAVYRQQMMKVTGEQPSDLPSMHPRSVMQRASQSSPDFLASLSFDSKPDKDDQQGKNSDDEDEDVPLGVLQAHGFPHKARPPTRLSNMSGARPQSQLSSYPQPVGATRNDTSTGGGGNLPAFAKNLPVDPHIGAVVTNTTNREALPYGNASSTATSNLPPGGLVNVIANEERARAMRRGSPNAQGSYGSPQQEQMNPMSSNDQMSQQMAQMMQMQMQWMQQMQQMMQMMPPGMQMPQMPGMPNMQGLNQPTMSSQGSNGFLQPPNQHRPMSIASQQSSASSFRPSQRAPSTMSHNLSGGTGPSSSAQSVFGMQQQYAPSVAPSERSNVGQPSRYRPVSTAPAGNSSNSNSKQSRTSTMSAVTVQGAKPQSKNSSRPQSQGGASDPVSKLTIKALNKPKRGVGSTSDDEDEEGWAEMQKKREARKSRWRGGRGKSPSSFGGSLDDRPQLEGLEGLYYEG